MNVLHAELQASSCDVELSVNDIPVWILNHRRAVFHAMPVHEYLVPGTNALRLRRIDVPMAAAPVSDAPARHPATARVRIAAYAEGAPLGQGGGQQLAVLEYREGSTPKSPPVADTSFDVPRWPFTWAWQSLAPVDWASPPVATHVLRWLQDFAARFQRADSAWLLAVLQPKMSDYCRAYGIDLAAEAAEFRGRMQRRAADPSFRVAPVAQADLALRPCAGSRLVDCVLATGEPAIRYADQAAGARGAIKLKIGFAGQDLVVFR